MTQIPLYPLRFEPIYEYRPWGGRRLANLLTAPLPEGRIGEAWLLSDREEHVSVVASGPLQGLSLRKLIEQSPEQILGELAGRFPRFPLLLKFLDARETLSVQVHPSDLQKDFLPAGETGKTEAWVVLEAGTEGRIFAGLKGSTSAPELKRSLEEGTITDCLSSFRPESGDAVLIPAGTVHSLGDAVVFEVQENSDVTFRLYDWDRADARTGQPRPLQIDQALACIDFAQGPIGPVIPILEEIEPVRRERLVDCAHFGMRRLHGNAPFPVGARATARVLVGINGFGELEHADASYAFGPGDVFLLPAVVGVCLCQPQGIVTMLEISLPDGPPTP